jgi:hypothetical protein
MSPAFEMLPRFPGSATTSTPRREPPHLLRIGADRL